MRRVNKSSKSAKPAKYQKARVKREIPREERMARFNASLEKMRQEVDAADKARVKGESKEASPRPLTDKQRRFLDNYLNSESPTYLDKYESAAAAGYAKADKQQGRVPTSQLPTNSLGVKRTLVAAFERAGIDDDEIARRIRAGFDANKTELVSYKGEVTDQVDMIAWGERRAYIELAMKARNDMPREEAQIQAALIIKVPPRQSSEAFEKKYVNVDAEVTKK